MIPNKFNMVDMGGIDLLESQGVVVSGLYQRLVDSISNCRYQCLYNWKFDGIDIAPTYVELTIIDSAVRINYYVWVTQDDVVHIYSIEPPPVEPVIQSLSIAENGTYTPEEGVDGFSPVVVAVPTPQLEEITITSNGVYTSALGGFSKVTVNVSIFGDVLYTLDISDGGRWINTGIQISNKSYIGFFRYDVDVKVGEYIVLVSDIPIYAGYKTLFSQGGRQFNISNNNGVLWISYNSVGTGNYYTEVVDVIL